ncbi:MAG: hypothetical protein KGJ89_01590 [Patescibacteria group bacterium]|nr:hypothetical protein [Patescibacteria group bacterium]MDE2015202.1 hypothetical protein [Patescibacteria group bacterium]MDE2226629.1 hypothetical protein [Patescibacteria group bacterium]
MRSKNFLIGEAGRVLGVAAPSAFFIALQLFASVANAAVSGTGIDISTPDQVVGIICRIAADMFWILIALSTVMVLFGAFTYVTAGESAEKVNSAHKIITYAAVGIVVALLARGFPYIVASVLGASSGTGIKGC